MTRWNGRDAIRISVSSHRTADTDVTVLLQALAEAFDQYAR